MVFINAAARSSSVPSGVTQSKTSSQTDFQRQLDRTLIKKEQQREEANKIENEKKLEREKKERNACLVFKNALKNYFQAWEEVVMEIGGKITYEDSLDKLLDLDDRYYGTYGCIFYVSTLGEKPVICKYRGDAACRLTFVDKQKEYNMMTALEKVRRLEEYISINHSIVDPVIETTINKLLARELNRISEVRVRLTDDISAFEKRYKLKSGEFYGRYESGEMGDLTDFVEWAATIEMLASANQQSALLETCVNQ